MILLKSLPHLSESREFSRTKDGPASWRIHASRNWVITGLLQNTENRGLCMRRECRERVPRHQLNRKPLVSDPGMHHGTYLTHVPWYMSESLTRGGGENVPGVPCTSATRSFAYLVRGPLARVIMDCRLFDAKPKTTMSHYQLNHYEQFLALWEGDLPVRGIHRWPVNSPQKGSVTQSFDVFC